VIYVALIARPRREAAAVAHLWQRWKASAFYPVRSVPDRLRTQRAGRTVWREQRILPGYVFASFDTQPLWHEVFDSPYIRDAIRLPSGHVAHLHPDDLTRIHALRQRVERADMARAQATMLRPGDSAVITAGTLSGLPVKVLKIKGQGATVRLRLFGADREVEVESLDALQKAAD
jgi:transcription antitermination factor NusG